MTPAPSKSAAFTELLKKELLLEWRQKYALNGILLYVISTVFIVYMAFDTISVSNWISLFWIITLFASVNAVAKSFMQESKNRMLYYYTIVSPSLMILAKMVYNFLLLIGLCLLTYLVFSLLLTNPVKNLAFWLLILVVGSMGFAFTFTMISAIAAKARNNATLMSILSFPIILPQLALLIRISVNGVAGGKLTASSGDFLALLAIDVIVLVVSLLLFPYLWRE